MTKQISVILSAIASVLLIFVILFAAMNIGMSDKTFINNEYTKLSLSKSMGISNSDLVDSCLRLINYMKGDVPDINIIVTCNDEKVQMFDQEQEISHMKDVRTLYEKIAGYAKYALVGAIFLYLFSALFAYNDGPFHSIGKGYIWGTIAALMILGFLGTWAVLDFSSFWTTFHQALFWNDDWLFDPTNSRMINMLPERFFQDLVIRIFLYALAAVVVLLVLAIIVVSKYNKKKREEYERALKKYKKAKAKQRRLEAEKAAALKAEQESAASESEEKQEPESSSETAE